MQWVHLATIVDPLPLAALTREQLREIQAGLSHLGYPVGDIDGLYGPKTRNAWAEFKTDVFPGNPDLVGRESIALLQQRVSEARQLGPGRDMSTKESTIAAIKDECVRQGIGSKNQIAYVLATTQWETAQTFKPVKEAFWLGEEWRRAHLGYYPYYGRGYVQLTWRNNYEKYATLLGANLVDQPDLALDPQVALFVLVHGFKTGTFTGRKLTDYVNDQGADFLNARRCINGTDRQHEIAALAETFRAHL